MKTLKKTLCLVLAVVMVVGVLILPASAVDATAKVEYNEEAVELLQGMNILQGKSGGVLDLESNVTRAEAATFMARLDATPAFMEKFSSKAMPFTDCEDVDWAKTAISYCYSQGILSGTSATTFEPTRGVTGHEMAKMLLCAMGYKADKEGFTGELFQPNVEILATKTGINKGIDDLSKPLTRGQVVTMIYNALFAGTVTAYEDDGTAKTFDKATTLYAETFEGKTVYGFVQTNQATGAEKTGLKVISDVNADVLTFSNDPVSYAIETGLDMIGHVLKVYCADADTIYYAEDVSEVKTVKDVAAADYDTKIGKSMGKGYEINNYAPVMNSSSWALTGTGDYIVFNGKVIAKLGTVAYTLDKVTKVEGTKVTLNNGGTAKTLEEKYKAYDGIAANDIVAYYVAGEMTYLSKAQKVTGTLDAIDGTKITVNGKAYTQLSDNNKSGIVNAASYNFKDTYEIYVSPDGVSYFVAYVPEGEEPPTPDEVDVFVVAVYKLSTTEATDAYGQPGETTYEYYVQALDMDGNELKRKISKTTYTTTFEAQETDTKKEVKKLMSIMADTTEGNTDCYLFGTATNAETSTAGLDAAAIKIGTNHYFASTVKFIYVNGVLSALKPEVKTGVQGVNNSTTIAYIATPVDSTKPEGNRTVSVVFVLNSVDNAKVEAGSGSTVTYSEVVFAWESDDVTAQAPYTDADGVKQAGYVHTVFIDGVQTEILTSTGAALKGFYTIGAKVDRLYTLESVAADKDDDVLIIGADNASGVKVTNMYNGLISLENTTPAVTDVSVAGATLINLTGNDKVPTNAAELDTQDSVCVVVTMTGTTVTGIKTIYVVATERAAD